MWSVIEKLRSYVFFTHPSAVWTVLLPTQFKLASRQRVYFDEWSCRRQKETEKWRLKSSWWPSPFFLLQGTESEGFFFFKEMEIGHINFSLTYNRPQRGRVFIHLNSTQAQASLTNILSYFQPGSVLKLISGPKMRSLLLGHDISKPRHRWFFYPIHLITSSIKLLWNTL